jgi:uncharacterized membrane protein SirB2
VRNDSTFQQWSRLLPMLAIAWLAVAGVLVFQLWPWVPRTKGQWVLLLVFGPPLYVLCEGVGEKFFLSKRGDRISAEAFSFKRIMVGVAVFLFVTAILAGASWLLTRP